MHWKISIMNVSDVSKLDKIAVERIRSHPSVVYSSQFLHISKLWCLDDRISSFCEREKKYSYNIFLKDS